jgi:hypothetical protein
MDFITRMEHVPNNGNGTFWRDWAIGQCFNAGARAALFADFDNDGYQDLFVNQMGMVVSRSIFTKFYAICARERKKF